MTIPLRIGAATLDTESRVLHGPARDVRLTGQPTRLLARLAERAGRVVPHADLVAALHDPYGRATARLAQYHLHAVRRALRDAGAGAGIASIRGRGVRLDVPARPDAPNAEPRGALNARHLRMVAAYERGASDVDLAERFGFTAAGAARSAIVRTRRLMREARA